MTPAFDETAVRSDIRARVDIVDLAREHGVDLRRVGDRHVGLCPFHAEKTPSFTISNGLFHCFSCGAGGSAFDFVMRAQGVGFREARTVLADRAGVSLDRARRNHPRRGPREPTARERAALERERVFDELRSDIWAVYREVDVAVGEDPQLRDYALRVLLPPLAERELLLLVQFGELTAIASGKLS